VQQQPDGVWSLGCELTQQLSDEDKGALQAEPDSWPDRDGLPEPSRETAPAGGTDPDLGRVCAAWPALPVHIRAAVMALVATAR
jgi:hypothetical protein